MARNPQDVTPAELEILQDLWQAGPSTIRQIADRLHPPQASTSRYATVQKLLDRLAEKGYVRRQQSLGVNVFSAEVGREELIGRRLRQVAEQLCDGSVTPLLTHLVRSQRLSAQERRELRALIEELSESPGESESGQR